MPSPSPSPKPVVPALSPSARMGYDARQQSPRQRVRSVSPNRGASPTPLRTVPVSQRTRDPPPFSKTLPAVAFKGVSPVGPSPTIATISSLNSTQKSLPLSNTAVTKEVIKFNWSPYDITTPQGPGPASVGPYSVFLNHSKKIGPYLVNIGNRPSTLSFGPEYHKNRENRLAKRTANRGAISPAASTIFDSSYSTFNQKCVKGGGKFARSVQERAASPPPVLHRTMPWTEMSRPHYRHSYCTTCQSRGCGRCSKAVPIQAAPSALGLPNVQ